MMVHHAIHHLKQATSDADQCVTSCKEAVSTGFLNRDYKSFSPGNQHQALHPYMMVYGKQKLTDCRWKVRKTLCYGCRWGQGMCYSIILRMQKVCPC
jgi:hypothetical protein